MFPSQGVAIKFFLLLVSVSFFTSCKSASLTISEMSRADSLKKYYQLSIETDAKENKQKFFDYFPSTFSEFNSLYGYNNGKAEILYGEADNHINGLLCRLSPNEIQGYYNKLIGLTYGSYWEADAINFLQRCIRNQFKENVSSFTKVLAIKNRDQVMQFFSFYFSGPPDHLLEKLPSEIEGIKANNPEMYKIALDTFKKTSKN